MSPSCRCHPPVRSSTQPRTSGSICDRPISPTVCSRPTPTSSTPAKTPGENFSPKPGASPRSRLATGTSSVRSSEGWYNLLVLAPPRVGEKEDRVARALEISAHRPRANLVAVVRDQHREADLLHQVPDATDIPCF